MSLFGPATPAGVQPVSGTTPSERTARGATKKTAKPDSPTRGSDEVDMSGAQSADAVRNLKSNGEEETADDRQQQDHYKPVKKKPDAQPHLDVSG